MWGLVEDRYEGLRGHRKSNAKKNGIVRGKAKEGGQSKARERLTDIGSIPRAVGTARLFQLWIDPAIEALLRSETREPNFRNFSKEKQLCIKEGKRVPTVVLPAGR